MQVLVLDQGYQPHRVIDWQRAISMLFGGKVEVVEEYQEEVRSVSLVIRMPAVVRLLTGVRHRQQRVKFSRFNVLVRDDFRCQYCGSRPKARDLTWDHVVPRSRGGGTTWQNIVTACRTCNQAKANRTPAEARMQLSCTPVRPAWLPTSPMTLRADHMPDVWRSWVYWNEIPGT